MKKTFKIICLISILLTVFSSVCMAQDSVADQENNVLATTSSAKVEEQPISIPDTNGDVYERGSSLLLNGSINGNSFLFGTKVTISGHVSGDLFVLAESLVVEDSAVISGNLFAIAQQITINGSINDVYVLSREFTLSKNAFIARDLKLYSSNSSFEGKVGRDLYIAGSFSFADKSQNLVGRDFYYSAQEELEIPDGIIVGNINFSKITHEEPTTAELVQKYITSFIVLLLYAVVVIALATFITPGFAKKATYSMSKKSFITATIGIISLLIIPFLSIFLLITGFLTYVGLALLIVYLLIISITISILGMAIGNYFANKLKNKTKDDLKIKDINLHMVFLGNPGTGKTTVARIIAEMLYNLKYIKQNKLIEVSSKDLVAEYVGQTAPKTMAVIERALGGVLFVDEAYSLASEEGSGNSFNKEAIATLIQAMENYRDNLVVIFAGYTKEMQAFLNANSGIVSRIGYTLDFKDYTSEELLKIFEGMVKKAGFSITKEACDEVVKVIDKYRNTKNFGNARFARNLYEKTIIKHASNTRGKKAKKDLKTIVKEDISTDNL